MPTAGVIAEFDPFHLGHEYLLTSIRRILGPETDVVAVMSGCFTQRGGAAVCTPQARAEMALRGGADLVLELPVSFAAASAERFARGGVEALLGTGVVDTLCFGSECGQAPTLRAMADALDSPAFSAALHNYADKGLPFAAARARALEQVLGAKCPEGANDLLDTEYLRFWPKDRNAAAIHRIDGGHGGSRSASQVRALLYEGRWEEALDLLPETSREILRRERAEGRCPASLKAAERAVLYRLRTMTASEFAAIPDCTEGLENRLVRAAGQAESLEEFYTLAKSKRYAHARIRRIALRAFLGITDLPEQVEYLRLLGANERGLALLREIKQKGSIPILTKSAHGAALEGAAKRQFELACRAENLWGLCLPRPLDVGWSFRSGPVVLKEKNL